VSANVETVRRGYEVLNSRDLDALFELADPEFALDNSRLVFNPDTYRGRAGMERWVTETAGVWDELRLTPTELTEVGDNVVAAVTVRGKGKGSGVDVEMPLFAVWTFHEGRWCGWRAAFASAPTPWPPPASALPPRLRVIAGKLPEVARRVAGQLLDRAGDSGRPPGLVGGEQAQQPVDRRRRHPRREHSRAGRLLGHVDVVDVPSGHL
jgi:ketosteroid isomerase-like protein